MPKKSSVRKKYGVKLTPNSLFTVDNVNIHKIVQKKLIPLLDKYNQIMDSASWRYRLCKDQEILTNKFNMLEKIPSHGIPMIEAGKNGYYVGYVKLYGAAFGFDHEFYMRARASDFIDKVKIMLKYDQRRILNEILRVCLCPTRDNGFVKNNYLVKSENNINWNLFNSIREQIVCHSKKYIVICDTGASKKLTFLKEYGEEGFGKTCFEITNWMPENYIIILPRNSKDKPFYFNQPDKKEWQGLLWIPGQKDEVVSTFPIKDSYVVRLFSISVKEPEMGVVLQISDKSKYESPKCFIEE